MWGLESLGIPFNATDNTVVVPLWAAGIAAGLVAVLFILALVRTGLAGTLVFLALIGFGGWAVWSWMEHTRTLERRTLEARLSALDTKGLAPGSALACLDGAVGETVESACEGSVFASPESTASAVSYTAARLSVLSDGVAFNNREPGFDGVLVGLRRALEQDRFGFVAHVLALRQNCTADRCEALRLFPDPARVRTHMREKTFDTHLARATPVWNSRPPSRTGMTPEATPVVSATPPMRGTPLPPGYNLPSAASIPPVSIMTPEATPTAPEPAQAGAPPGAPRRPAQQPQQQQQQQQQQPPRRAQQPPRPAANDAATPRPLPPPTRIQ